MSAIKTTEADMTNAPASRLLKFKDVMDRVALSRAAIYRRLDKGQFPKPIDLGPNCPRWREADINAYIDGRWPVDQAA